MGGDFLAGAFFAGAAFLPAAAELFLLAAAFLAGAFFASGLIRLPLFRSSEAEVAKPSASGHVIGNHNPPVGEFQAFWLRWRSAIGLLLGQD